MNWIDWIKFALLDIRDFLMIFFITYFVRVYKPKTAKEL